jgi:hypothetical protein
VIVGAEKEWESIDVKRPSSLEVKNLQQKIKDHGVTINCQKIESGRRRMGVNDSYEIREREIY